MSYRYFFILIIGILLGGIFIELLHRSNSHAANNENINDSTSEEYNAKKYITDTNNNIEKLTDVNDVTNVSTTPKPLELSNSSININKSVTLKEQQAPYSANTPQQPIDKKLTTAAQNIETLTTNYENKISEMATSFIELAESTDIVEDIDSVAYAIEKVIELDQDRDQKFSPKFVTKVIDAINSRSDITEDTRHKLLTGLIGSADDSHIEQLADIANYYTDNSNRASLLAVSETLLHIDTEDNKQQLSKALIIMQANPALPDVTKTRITTYLAELN